jgi:ankyrin repeat protein
MFENADALRKLAALNPTPEKRKFDPSQGSGSNDLNLQLTEAVSACDVERVRSLGGQGARPTAADGDGELPIHLACRCGDPAMVCNLIKELSQLRGFDPNAQNRAGATALHSAAARCDASVVRMISALPGFDGRACNKGTVGKMQTPGHYAVKDNSHYMEVLSALAEVDGFNVNAHDERGMGILNYAAQNRYADAIGWMSTHGISEDEMYGWDRHGQCAIYWAAENEAADTMQAILELDGYSFLEQMRRYRHPETGVEDDQCRDPLVSAIEDNADILIRKVADHLRARGEATTEIIEEIFDAQLDCMPNGDPEGTLMKLAVQLGSLECIVELYLAGASTSIYDLLPAIVGAKHVPRLAEGCCDAVRKRFEDDFGASNVAVESVEVNTACPDGLINVFLSALDVFRAKHGRVPPTRFLWHCSTVPEIVLRSGLNGNFASMDLNVYGVGLYVATDAKLSGYYARPDEHGVCTMLLVLTMLGKTGVREPLIGIEEESMDDATLKASMAEMQVDLTQPQHRNPPIGCDSAIGPHAKEVVVYSSTAALPAFVVRYRLLNGELTNPYTADTASRCHGRSGELAVGVGAEYLRSLQEVPPLLQGAVAADEFGVEGVLDIEDDARLLPMGTFPTTRAAAVELRRKVQTDGFSAPGKSLSVDSPKVKLWAKVGELTREVEWLRAQLGELQQVEAENMALKIARGSKIEGK